MYELGVRAVGRPRYRCEGTVETKLIIGYVGLDCSSVAQVMFRWRTNVGALRYKPEGLGFDSLWCHWNFSLM